MPYARPQTPPWDRVPALCPLVVLSARWPSLCVCLDSADLRPTLLYFFMRAFPKPLPYFFMARFPKNPIARVHSRTLATSPPSPSTTKTPPHLHHPLYTTSPASIHQPKLLSHPSIPAVAYDVTWSESCNPASTVKSVPGLLSSFFGGGVASSLSSATAEVSFRVKESPRYELFQENDWALAATLVKHTLFPVVDVFTKGESPALRAMSITILQTVVLMYRDMVFQKNTRTLLENGPQESGSANFRLFQRLMGFDVGRLYTQTSESCYLAFLVMVDALLEAEPDRFATRFLRGGVFDAIKSNTGTQKTAELSHPNRGQLPRFCDLGHATTQIVEHFESCSGLPCSSAMVSLAAS